MFTLSDASKQKLATADPRLQRVLETVVARYGIPVTVLFGHRSKADQDAAVKSGKSELPWPKSKHNRLPAEAIDVAPMRWDAATRKWVIDWNDHGTFGVLAGLMLATARELGVALKWGADWDGDFDLREHSLRDGPHFELIED